MFGFGKNVLKLNVWYHVDDQIKIKYVGDNHVKIDYRGNIMTMDIPNYIYAVYLEQVLLPKMEALKSGQKKPDLKSLSKKELNDLLDLYSKKEEFELCAKIKNEIDGREEEV